ncbi:MAG TPA: nuclear transport factor 2 family protein [Candidatus Binatia bacterium]|nr:nuclear transport factor 2 family protein [Candidatus Binatia bacterium]
MTDHATGTTYDREGMLATWGAMLGVPDMRFRSEPLATLGDALALQRESVSAPAVTAGTLDVAAYEIDVATLGEADAQGKPGRIDVFSIQHLGDAVARLYERWAERLPPGPQRVRAAATARSVATLLLETEVARVATAFDPGIDFLDHRPLGLPSQHGTEQHVKGLQSLRDVSGDIGKRIDDVLALEPGAFLVRWTQFGTARAGGGTYERTFLCLYVFGPDGLATRNELFAAEREAEALARFEALAAEPTAPEARARRVRPNGATAFASRLGAAFAARDLEGVASLLAEDLVVVEHPLGLDHDREGTLRSFRALLDAGDPTFRLEPLASLGDSLALFHEFDSSHAVTNAPDGLVAGAGAYERETISLSEVDRRGRCTRAETFDKDHLGLAVESLYRRYADLLPDGPARARAAATARSVAALYDWPTDFAHFPAVLDPGIEVLDHRPMGFFAARGAEQTIAAWRSLFDVSSRIGIRVDDVLALRDDGLVMGGTQFGTARDGGGVYDRPSILLALFGTDGRVTRLEFFTADGAEQALARFDALRREPTVRSIPRNGGTAYAARLDAAIVAKSAETIAALVADPCEVIDHTTGATFDRAGLLHSFLALMGAREPVHRLEPLVALGESLALCRASAAASGFSSRKLDVGPYEGEALALVEVDRQERMRRCEIFARDRLADAVARMYERHAALLPDGSERVRAAATARSVVALAHPSPDVDRYANAIARDLAFVDHRVLGFGSARGADVYLRGASALLETAADVTHRFDAVLGLRPDALLVRRTTSGTHRTGGGIFETPIIQLWAFGPDGRLARDERFDADREVEARARFDRLTAGDPTRPRIENAATRSGDRLDEAWRARDWDAVEASFASTYRETDRRGFAHLHLDRARFLESLREAFEMSVSVHTREVVATRGDRLALFRCRWEGAHRSIGPSEVGWLGLLEMDNEGKRLAGWRFEADDLDAARVELEQRYAAGEVAAHGPIAATMRAFLHAFEARDWQALGSLFADDLVVHDHRPIGWETLDGSPAYVRALRTLLDLAPDARLRLDHVDASAHALLWIAAWVGVRDGGAFETPWISVSEHDHSGRVRRFDQYDPDQLDEARARFEAIDADAIRRSPVGIPPNAASRVRDRVLAACEARDWQGLRSIVADGFTFEDRTRQSQVSGDFDLWLRSLQFTWSAANVRVGRETIGTAGERIVLSRTATTGGREGSPFEVELIVRAQIDVDQKLVAVIFWDLEDRAAAFDEAHARFVAGEAALVGGQAPVLAHQRAIAQRDWVGVRDTLADDLVVQDHRPLGPGAMSRDGFLEWVKTLTELAPDTHYEVTQMLAWNRHGRVEASVIRGTVPDGGPFENAGLRLVLTDGERVTRFEMFEPHDVDGALARFEALTAPAAAAEKTARRVRPNAATALSARLSAAVAARDADALAGLFAEGDEVVDHTTGVVLGREGTLTSFVSLVKARDAIYRTEPVATLGEWLGLSRDWSSASGLVSARFDVGPFQREHITLSEVDAEGRQRRGEVFAPDRLGDGVARLYERYADLLPAGAARDRAAVTARAVIGYLRVAERKDVEEALRRDDEAPGSSLAPDAEFADHRPRVEDVVDVRAGGFLIRVTNSGTLHATGGRFERCFLALHVFDDAGFARHLELFDADQEAEACARFDRLLAEPTGAAAAGARVPARRVHANAATEILARVEALCAARDRDALSGCFADDYDAVDHATGIVFDRSGELRSLLALLESDAPSFRVEALGALGESLALFRLSMSARGLVRADLDVGPYRVERVAVIEVDAHGLERRAEYFAPDRLGDAVVRLYERHAELLPEDHPTRARAAATARSMAAFVGPVDVAPYRAANASNIDIVDHRILGTWSGRGTDHITEGVRSLLDLADGVTTRIDDVLAVTPEVLLARWANVGTARAGGGSFELACLVLVVYGADGRAMLTELFDLDREDKALARFDQMTAAHATS